MGNRINVVIKNKEAPPVVLYSHWYGKSMLNIVRKALSRKQRWDDAPYLTRIIFCEMLKQDGKEVLDGETGFGIQTTYIEEDNPTIFIDVDKQTVSQKGWKSSFQEFIQYYQLI